MFTLVPFPRLIYAHKWTQNMTEDTDEYINKCDTQPPDTTSQSNCWRMKLVWQLQSAGTQLVVNIILTTAGQAPQLPWLALNSHTSASLSSWLVVREKSVIIVLVTAGKILSSPVEPCWCETTCEHLLLGRVFYVESYGWNRKADSHYIDVCRSCPLGVHRWLSAS